MFETFVLQHILGQKGKLFDFQGGLPGGTGIPCATGKSTEGLIQAHKLALDDSSRMEMSDPPAPPCG
jgi:hypothetical protein